MPLIRSVVVLVALLGATTAQAQCLGAPVTAPRFAQKLDAAEATVRSGDLQSLDLDMGELQLAVPCLSEPVAPDLAARLHLLTAIQADPFRADAVRTAFEELQRTPPETRKVPKPRVGETLFDGTPSRDRPIDRPTLFQLADGGSARTTALLWPDDPLPDYPAVPQTRNALIAGAGASALLAGLTFGGAWIVRSQFESLDPDYDADTIRAKARTTNALVVVSGTLGAAAIGMGVGAIVVGER